jgi:DNA anti-recombination protein RmuC
MLDSTDMSTPVTRGELRDVLAQVLAPLATKVELEMWGGALLARIESGERLLKQLAERIDASHQRLIERIVSTEQQLIERIDGTEQRLSDRIVSTEQRLSDRIDGIEQRIDGIEQRLSDRIDGIEQRIDGIEQRLSERIDGTEQRLLTELARHTSAAQEDMSTQISVIDDKYDDLPVRVSLLEATAFPPRRR